MTAPFDYPPAPHVRRHGPQRYANSASYRPWLRDEFSFRCVYCLLREKWGRPGSFGIDHFLAIALYPGRSKDYDNLLYACSTCNATKADRVLPDPTSVLTSVAVDVEADGTIHADDPKAAHLIELLGLDSPQSSELRLLWIGIIALAAKHDPELDAKLMGFPDDLPNLARLHPPGGNSRPKGIEQSYFVKKQNAILPEVY